MIRLSLLAFCSLVVTSVSYASPAADKIIAIVVTPKAQAIIGRDTLDFEKLTHEIQERLWKSWLGTGKMYDAVQLQFIGEVSATIQKNAIDAIKKAQDKALTEVCLQKYKNRFADIGSKRQEKLKKQLPVLFQPTFTSSPI